MSSTDRPALGANRTAIFACLNVAFLLVVLLGAAYGGGDNPRILYLILLFASCSSIVLYLDGLNGRYTILVILLSLYFVYYGALDLLGVFVGQAFTSSVGILDWAEVAILLGACGLISGYWFAVTLALGSKTEIAVNDWNGPTIVSVGLILWACGLFATCYWQFVIERVQTHADLNFGAVTGIALVVGRMLQPLGMALIGYRLVVSRSRHLLILVLVILVIEFISGFLADSKELSIRGILLVIAAKVLVDAEIPKKWLISIAAISILAFPIFQAYRFEVLQEREVDRVTALENIGKSLETALNSNKLEKGGEGGKSNSQFGYNSFLGRISLKGTMEILLAKTGKEVKFQDGHTIALLVMSLVPRFIYADKPDTSVGQLFNREFKISLDPDTYISATHLGELYWNFGWPGILFGAPLMGFLLGSVNSRFALREHRSVTRFLVLVVSIYFICLRFEGGIALQYTLWLRSLMLIGVMHVIFARDATTPMDQTVALGSKIAEGDESKITGPFPNLLQ